MLKARKHCPKCETEKPAAEFKRNRAARDGLSVYCKPCESARNAEWAKRNPKRIKEIERRRYLKHKQQRADYQRHQNAANPARYRAHAAVRSALEAGRIKQSRRCNRCGGLRKTVAHHDDYSRPLAIEWLCRSCHTKEHQ